MHPAYKRARISHFFPCATVASLCASEWDMGRNINMSALTVALARRHGGESADRRPEWVFLALAACVPSLAAAQATAPATSATPPVEENGLLAEIVVTAQKREQGL